MNISFIKSLIVNPVLEGFILFELASACGLLLIR